MSEESNPLAPNLQSPSPALPGPEPAPAAPTPRQPLTLRVWGVGNAGISVLEHLLSAGLPAAVCVALNTEPVSGSAAEKLQLETTLMRGLGTGGDPQRGRELAEEQAAKLKALCAGVDVVLLVAGLGGGAGTGICPVVARVAKEAGALVLAFVKTPFACEGARRQALAQEGLEELCATADGVICLPNQKVFQLMDENTSVLDTFKLTNELLGDGVRGVWRLLAHKGLIELHFSELCDLLRARHAESAFATIEAMGATRSRNVLDRLKTHPLLDGGQVLAESSALLVSLVGGPDLTMAEVNRVMEELNELCGRAQVLMGATVLEEFRERLSVTVIAARNVAPKPERERPARGQAEELDTQLLTGSAARPGSRFVPPPPTLAPEQLEQMLARQGTGSRIRKTRPKLRQGQLPLEIVSKGRFDKSEPTIHKGEDLDVPTYIRRGVSLN